MHENIIRYCNRPFDTVDEMDVTLIQNWNDLVGPDDTVYFLGDLTLNGKLHAEILALLNGNKMLIQGNHDPWHPDTAAIIIKSFDGVPVLLVHNPRDVPDWYSGWVIHGHQHNNTPLFNQDLQRVNVSVENTDYQPIMIQTIIEQIKEVG